VIEFSSLHKELFARFLEFHRNLDGVVQFLYYSFHLQSWKIERVFSCSALMEYALKSCDKKIFQVSCNRFLSF
jgi:hypothetical protein